MTEVVRSVASLQSQVDKWHRANLRVALVPTMGYLHDAHIALVKAGNKVCARTVVSIFVNPKQFGPKEDFSKYPRDETRDLDILKNQSVDLVYIPAIEEVYPAGFSAKIEIPSLTTGLCAAGRPGHFGGVATVCTKLFNQCKPDVAIFGEKDYQQLQIIRRLVKDLDIGVEIHGIPIVREKDGLAISSRNVHLTKDGRARAANINGILTKTAEEIVEGDDIKQSLQEARIQLEEKLRSKPEYLELCNSETLAPVSKLEAPSRLLTAIQVDQTRLIDNCPVIPIN